MQINEETVRNALASCIYKYGPMSYLDRTLEKGTLGFSSLNNFNDIYEREYRIIHYFNNLEEQKNLLSSRVPSPFDQQNTFIEGYFKSIKITCFSSEASNNLLWAHYAEDHKGICFCFVDKAPFGKVISRGNVNYSSHIPEVPIFQDRTTEGMLRAHLDGVILTKALEWSYEREIRYFVRQDETFLNYNPSALKAVILGRRVSNKKIIKAQKIIDNFNQLHEQDVMLLYAHRIAGSYRLGIHSDKAFRDNSEDSFEAATPVCPDLDTPLVTIPSSNSKNP